MKRKFLNTGNERGSALVEFMFCSVILVPFLMGVIAIGIELTREIEVTQICRDAAHMHAYGVDFSVTANKSLIVKAATSLGITTTGGKGAIILSTIKMIADTDCQAGNLTADSQNCPNLNHPVFTRRILIGNNSFGSAFDSNGPPITDSTGTVSQNRTLTVAADRVDSFNKVLVLQAGQTAYLGEVFLKNDDLTWTQIGGSSISARSIF